MRRLWPLCRDGVLRDVYPPSGPGAVLVLETAARHEPRATLAATRSAGGIAGFEFIELNALIAFDVLFACQQRP